MRPAIYTGSSTTRRELAHELGLTGKGENFQAAGDLARPAELKSGQDDDKNFANFIITSYPVLRADADVLGGQV